MTMWNDYEKIARRLDRIASAFERIANALETANIIEADRKTEPRGCDADCNEDCTECAKEWQDWKDQMWAEAVIASRDEPFDKDINVRSKTEPQTDMAEDIVRSYGVKAESYRQAKAKTEPQTDCSWK